MTRNPIAAAMPEDRGSDSLDAHVRKLIADLGLFGYHPRNSKGSAAGWPDWVIIGRAGILYRELKSEAGSLSPEQRRVGELITKAGGNWALWRAAASGRRHHRPGTGQRRRHPARAIRRRTMTAVASLLSDRDRRRLAERVADLEAIDQTMRQRGSLAPLPPPTPLHRMAQRNRDDNDETAPTGERP
jgi:hypothetical protein